MKRSACLGVSLLLFSCLPAFGQSCRDFINGHAAWASANAQRRLLYTIVTNQASTSLNAENVAGWSQGELRAEPCTSARPQCGNDGLFLKGSGSQLFSDRTLYVERPIPAYLQRFASRRGDLIDLDIYPSGQIAVTLRSWGNGQLSFAAECHDQAMVGQTPGAGNRGTALYIITLARFDGPGPGF